MSGIWSLQGAAFLGNIGRTKELLAEGADVSEQNYWGETALHLACRYNKFEIARLLLDAGANAEAKAHHGLTPLHYACKKEHLRLARLMLERGAAVDSRTDDGWTALQYACGNNRKDVVGLLLDYGANMEKVTMQESRQGESASNSLRCSEGYFELPGLMLSKGASITEGNAMVTPLEIACVNGHLEIVWLLLHRRPWLIDSFS